MENKRKIASFKKSLFSLYILILLITSITVAVKLNNTIFIAFGFQENDYDKIYDTYLPYGYSYMRIHKEDGDIKTVRVPYNEQRGNVNNTTTPLPIRYRRNLRRSQDPNRAIYMVFMASGFDNNRTAFEEYALGAANYTIGFYPFNLFSHLFTVYAIHTTTTNQSNFEHWWNGMADDGRELATARAKEISPKVQFVQILVNEPNRHAAFAFSPSENRPIGVAITSTGVYYGAWTGHHAWTGSWGTIVHEFGHSFGDLRDEIQTTTREAANVTRMRNADFNAGRFNDIRWGHWVGHDTRVARNDPNISWSIGRRVDGEIITSRRLLSHAGNYVWIGPYDTCLMIGTRGSFQRLFDRVKGKADLHFSAVSSAELTRRMANIAGEPFFGLHYTFPTPRRVIPNASNVSLNNATRILPYTFNGNTTLHSLTIPAYIDEIGRYAFLGATGLRYIYNHSTTPQQIDATTFAGTGVYAINRAGITVKVPRGTIQEYRNAGWTGFNLIEKAEIWDGTIAPNFAGGTGTYVDPWQISNGSELARISVPVHSNNRHFVLTENIYLNNTFGWRNWEERGQGLNQWNPMNLLRGNFDGRGFAIRGLYINRPSENSQGLFRDISFSTVKNLSIEQGFIRGNSHVGAMAGLSMESTITNSHNSARVDGGGGITGGLVGFLHFGSVLNYSHNAGDVTGGGGLVGSTSNATIVNSKNSGTVTRNTSVGGIVGSFGTGSRVINNINLGVVTATNGTASGIVGSISGSVEGEILNNINMGIVIGNRTGGIAGSSSANARVTVELNYFLKTNSINSSTNFISGNSGINATNNRTFNEAVVLRNEAGTANQSINIGGERTTLLSALNAAIDTYGILPILSFEYLRWTNAPFPTHQSMAA